MDLRKGDFILVKSPKFGFSAEHMDLGPFIVQIKKFNFSTDTIETIHYLRIDELGFSRSEGTVSQSDIIAKIHPRDVEALFKVPK